MYQKKKVKAVKLKTENFIPKEVYEYDIIADTDSAIYRKLMSWP